MLLHYPSQLRQCSSIIAAARRCGSVRRWGTAPHPHLHPALPQRHAQQRQRHRHSAVSDADAGSLAEAKPGADPGSALTGDEPHM